MAFPSPPLAFIFGFPRSGTTLLAKLLDSHPSVLYLHEPLSKGHGLLVHKAIHDLGHGYPLDQDLRHGVTSELIDRRADFLQPPFFREDFARVPWGAPLAWTWKQVTGRSGTLLTARPDRRRIRLVVVKDGLNLYAQPLARSLDARSLILLRHPCAVVNSILRGHKVGAMEHVDRQWYWESLHDSLRNLGYDETAVRSMHDDEFEALRWLVSNAQVRALDGDPHYKVLTYGRLFRQMAEVADEILPWLGLEVQPSTRAFVDRVARPRRNLVRRVLGPKKIYFSLVPRSKRPDTAWQTELHPTSQRRVLRIVQPFPLHHFWPDMINEASAATG